MSAVPPGFPVKNRALSIFNGINRRRLLNFQRRRSQVNFPQYSHGLLSAGDKPL